MFPTIPSATKIMLIRHAEKPNDPALGPDDDVEEPADSAQKPEGTSAPYGVNSNGVGDPESLTVQGWQRAGALATFFDPSCGPLQDPQLATPQFIYASKAVPHSDSDSMRPQETVTPLINKLKYEQMLAEGCVNFEFPKGQEDQVAASALTCAGVVLICWEHINLLAIVQGIIKDYPGTQGIPKKWPGSHYDLVWILDWNASTGMYDFSQVPQLLLAGDKHITQKLLKKEGL
jgi:hypothetical protein